MTPEAIERAAAAAWPATEAQEAEGWLLRASPGLDRARSNTALPLVPHPDVAVVRDWYAARGAPPMVQVGPLPGQAALDAELVGAGWEAIMRVDVLAAPLADLPAPAKPVAVLGQARGRWLEAWARAEGRPDVAAHDEHVFSRLPVAGYALAPGGGAVGLGIVAEGAMGLFCMATRPDARRQGLALAVVAALGEWARGVGATTAYLQVTEENAGAQALYRRAGFTRSHGYVHRRLSR